MINEIRLRPVPGYGTAYWVSNDGRVFSMKRDDCIELRLFDHCNGRTGPRMTVQLYGNSNNKRNRKTWAVHILVALAFELVKKPGDYLLRHYDGNYKNNCVTNLIWGTDKDNAADRKRHEEQWNQEDEREAQTWV